MLSWISQTFAVTLLNLRTIPRRLGSSGVAIVGIAGVVVVLVSVLSIAAGFTAAKQRFPPRCPDLHLNQRSIATASACSRSSA